MNFDFSGQTVIVTGAAHGFGRAIALAFAEHGASVWVCDILADSLEETHRLCETAGAACHSAIVNVRDRDAVFGFVQSALDTDRKVDILVNNAGGVLGQVGRPLEEISTEDWNSIYEVNTRAAFYFAQAAVPSMKAHRRGRIINISSGAGLGISLTGIQAYASAKAAQIGLTRQLAHELGAWNITVNNIAPGFVLSNPTTQRQWDSYGDEGQQSLVNNIALKRLGS
ncbi:MAG: SDR family NAD(P)-dependent oxidoreductase, partial [Aggregatilineales bacterium]